MGSSSVQAAPAPKIPDHKIRKTLEFKLGGFAGFQNEAPRCRTNRPITFGASGQAAIDFRSGLAVLFWMLTFGAP
jgi:hypothetical protein